MGRLFLVSLPATGETIYRCKHCDTHLAYDTDIISKLFRCKHGKAYLFDKLVNVNVGEKDDRMMTTGMHSVCDIFCVACGSILGWKYVISLALGLLFYCSWPHLRRARGTRKASSSWRGARWWVPRSGPQLLLSCGGWSAQVKARRMLPASYRVSDDGLLMYLG